MAPKRRASQDVGPTNNEKKPTRRITDRADKWTDTETGTLWKFVSPDRIRGLLGKSPHECSVVKRLGLLDTLSIEYARPDWEMVKEYIRNFDEERGWSLFQGKKLPFNIDVLRDAFKLPAGDPSTHKARWKGPEICILFARPKQKGGKYCLDWLAKDYKHWEGPLRVVTELLLGRRRPSSVTGKIMWYFCCYLWEEVPECRKPAVMPDWAQLMHEDLKNELTLMRDHLNNGQPDPKAGKPAKNPPFYGCSAIMQLLLYFSQEPITPPILKSVNATRFVEAASGCSAASAEQPGVEGDLGCSAASAEHPGAEGDFGCSAASAEHPGVEGDFGCSAASPEHPGVEGDLGFSTASGEHPGVEGDFGCSAASPEHPGVKADLGCSAASAEHAGASQEEHGRERRAERQVTFDTDDEQIVRRDEQSVAEHAGGEGEEQQSHSVGSVRSRANEQEDIFRKLESKVGELEAAREISIEQVKLLESQILELQTARDGAGAVAKQKLQSLQEELDKATTHSAGASKTAESLEEREKEILQQKHELDLKEDRISELEKEVLMKGEDNEKLQSRVFEQQEEFGKVESKVGELEDAREFSIGQVKLLESQLLELQTARDGAEAVAKQKLQSLQEELDKATTHSAGASKTAESLEEREKEILQQKHELDLKEDRISELEKEVLMKGEDNEKLQSRVFEQQEEFGKVESKVGELEDAREFSIGQVKLLESQLLELQTARDDAEAVAKQNLQSLLEELKKATTHAAGASKTAESLQEREKEILQQKHELGLKEDRISELEKEVLMKGEENEKLQSRVFEQQEEFRKVEYKVGELEDAREFSDGQVKLLESQVVQLQTGREDAESVAKQKLQSLQEELDKATTHAAGASKKVASLQEREQGAQNELKRLQQKLVLALKENSFLQSELDVRKRTVQDVGNLKDSMERVRKQYAEALRIKAAAESDLIKTRNLLQAMHATNAANVKKISDQSVEITGLKANLSEEQTKSENLNKMFGEMLDSKMSEETIAAIAKEDEAAENIRTSTIRPTNHASTSSRPEMHIEQEVSDKSGSESGDDEYGLDVTFPMTTGDEPQIIMSGSDLVEEAEPPHGHLVVRPKEHQKKGLAWMIKRESTDTPSPRGGLLADDQGMGKTLQAIMLILSERPRPCSTLVLCPVGLLKQWVNEIRNMCGPLANIRTLLYHGSGRNKPAPPRFKDYDVVVTSYSTLETECEKHNIKQGQAKHKISQLFTMDWYRLILDEAHIIKNRKAKIALAVFRVKAQTRWCLTGTPVQNTVEDMFSFFKVLGYDKIQDYERDFKPMEKRCKTRFRTGIAELRRHLAPFTLRRMKKLLNLPGKTCDVLEVDFAEESHREVYESIMEKSNSVWMQANAKGAKNTVQTLALLCKCRQACDDPRLATYAKRSRPPELKNTDLSSLRRKLLSIEKCNACQEDIVDVTDGVYISKTCEHVYCEACFGNYSANLEDNKCLVKRCKAEAELISVDDILPMPDFTRSLQLSYTKPSSKLVAVMEYVKNLPPLSNTVEDGSHVSQNVFTEKVIVFSQWTSALSLVQERFNTFGVTYERVDGSMSLKDRAEALDAFSNKPQIQVLLLSLKACNVGLNIVAANHVILLDGWWNPMVEDQAVDRCHRIGQTRPVTVVRIIVRGTIETRILDLQEKKRGLETSVLSDEISEAPKKRHPKKDRVSDIDYLLGNRRK